jgi:hypothetical protein
MVLITSIRIFFDKGILKSYGFDLPVIVVVIKCFGRAQENTTNRVLDQFVLTLIKSPMAMAEEI